MLQIIEPANCHRLTTLEAARAEIGLAPGDTSEDALLADLIDEVSAAIETFTGRVFALETVEENVTLDKAAWAFLPVRFPVRAVLALEVHDYPDGNGPDDGIIGKHGQLFLRERGQYRRAPWPHQRRIEIRYRAGFALPGQPDRDLPHAVERAAIRGVATLFEDPCAPVLSPEVKELLQPFTDRKDPPGSADARRARSRRRSYGRLSRIRY